MLTITQSTQSSVLLLFSWSFVICFISDCFGAYNNYYYCCDIVCAVVLYFMCCVNIYFELLKWCNKLIKLDDTRHLHYASRLTGICHCHNNEKE